MGEKIGIELSLNGVDVTGYYLINHYNRETKQFNLNNEAKVKRK